jgi:hypothetical protein
MLSHTINADMSFLWIYVMSKFFDVGDVKKEVCIWIMGL